MEDVIRQILVLQLFMARTREASHCSIENPFCSTSYLHLYLSVFTHPGQEATNSKGFNFTVKYYASKQAIAYVYYYLKGERKH